MMGRRTRKIVALFLMAVLLTGCANNPGSEPQVPLYPDESQTPTEEPSTAFESMLVDDLVIASAPDALPTETTAPQAPRELTAGQRDPSREVHIAVITDGNEQYHPLKCTQRDFYNINALVFESLVALDETMRPTPLLADRWTVDGNEWTFKLRSGIKFHNGEILNALDVEKSFEELMRYPETAWYPLAQCIESVRAIDDTTVVVTSKEAGIMLLYAMTFPILQRGSITTAFPKGTGPYWYVEYNPDASLRLESNPLWWKVSSGEVQAVVAHSYRSTIEAMSAVESGEIDALATRNYIVSLSRTLNDRMSIDYATYTYECIVPNFTNTVLSSLATREALMYAIDRTTLAGTAYQGMVQESEVPVTPGSWIYDAQATRYNYSPERALKILMDDGWRDTDGNGILEKELNGLLVEFHLTLITYNEGHSSIRSEAALAIAEQLRKVGITVKVETGPRNELEKKLTSGDFDLALVSFNLSQMPDLSFLFSSSGSMNFSRYEDAAMDELLKRAYTAPTENEFTSAMSEIQLAIVRDLPVLGLYFKTGVLVSKKNINGLYGVIEGNVMRGIEGTPR